MQPCRFPSRPAPQKAKRLRIVDPTTVLSRPGPQNQMCKSHGGVEPRNASKSWTYVFQDLGDSHRVESRADHCRVLPIEQSLRTNVVRSPAHQCLRAGCALPAQSGPRSAQERSSLAASGLFLAERYHVRISDLRAGSEGGFTKELVPISSASEVPDSPGDSLAGRGG